MEVRLPFRAPAISIARWAWQHVLRRPIYEIPYVRSYVGRLRTSVMVRTRAPALDLAFVLPQISRGWILEGICDEIARRFHGKSALVDHPGALPEANAYFYPHYSLFPEALRDNPHLWARKNVVLYTHPRDIGISRQELVYCLRRATLTITMCSSSEKDLVAEGMPPARVKTILMGADPGLFPTHTRGSALIGFSTAYYARKAPERIIELIRTMPHRRFALLGRNWRQYARFPEMANLPNLEYIECPYSEYQDFYKRLDVFVSMARLEGGPIPLIEAMMSNVVPVATRTGFAPDIIDHGQNGFLFDCDAPISQVAQLVESALRLKADIRASVRHLTWERFATAVLQYM